MIIQHGLAKTGGYASTAPAVKNQSAASKTQSPAAPVRSSESKLSSKAASFLAQLRKDRSDFDFIIADAGDDMQTLVKQSDKEFTVVYSTAELERMASDPKYAAEKNQQIETTLRMTEKICEQYGYTRTFGKNTPQTGELKGVGAADTDGKLKLLAYLKKFAEKQREISENGLAAKARGAVNEKENRDFVMNAAAKSVVLEATSPEGLSEKLKNIDWSGIIAERLGNSVDLKA